MGDISACAEVSNVHDFHLCKVKQSVNVVLSYDSL